MAIRCKFRLTEIHTNCFNSEQKTFIFYPCYDPSIEEDRRFYNATPTGRLDITVNNPVVLNEWKLGSFYYFDVNEVKNG